MEASFDKSTIQAYTVPVNKETSPIPEEAIIVAEKAALDQETGEQNDLSPEEDLILNSFTVNFHTFVRISRVMGARSIQDAEDIAQASFIKAWVHRDSFDGINFNGWMTRIVRNTTYDMGRSAVRRARILEQGSEEANEWRMTQVPSEVAIDRDFEILEMRKQLDQALATIPNEQRQAIELMYFEDLSYSEIADVLNIPLGTVKSRLSRGLQKMHDAIGNNPLVSEYFFSKDEAGESEGASQQKIFPKIPIESR